jgi:hypothetical protein
MELLRVQKRTKIVYGTAIGMSDPDVLDVSRAIDNALAQPGTQHIENKLRCTELFDYYERTLPS